MFKKNNVLAFILALISTSAVLGLGYVILTKINFSRTATKSDDLGKSNLPVSNGDNSNDTNSAISFSAPGIVPMGISVKINGSDEMGNVNKLLKRSFQKEFPGTTVDVDTDGNEAGIRLLLSGQVDLAAIARPLNEDELSQGLTAVTVEGKHWSEVDPSDTETLFYAYREPANFKVEAFLGHLFSDQGQEVIVDL